MAKIVKRTLTLLLCALIAVASFIGCFSVSAAADVLFKDEFQTTSLGGWASASVGKVADGSYILRGTAANTVAGQKTAAGMGVVANLAIRRATDSATGQPYESGTASILFHASVDGKTSYEFGLGVRQNGLAYLMVCQNRADGKSTVLKKNGSDINGVAGGKIYENMTYELKILALDSGKLQFFVNNQLFHEVTDTLKSGLAGISVYNADAVLEDILLQKLGEKKVESLQVLNIPEEVALGSELGIKVQANYSGIYGTQILDESAKGLTVSGYPQTVGKSTLKANYGGKSATFQVNFVAAAQDKEIYTADFTKPDGWNCGKSTALAAFAWQIKNNKLTLEYPDVTGINEGIKASASAKTDLDLKAVPNYRINATATITHDNKTPNPSRVGTVEFSVNSKYSVRIALGGAVSLMKGTAAVESGKVDGVALSKKIDVALEVYNNMLLVTVDGQTALSYAFTDGQSTPELKVQAVNGGVDVHSYTLTQLPKKSVWYIRSATLVDAEGVAVKKAEGRGLPYGTLFLNVVYGDGSARKIPVTADMVSGYNPNTDKAHTVTVTLGNVAKTFTFTPNKFLFQDTFEGKYNSKWSFTHPEYAKWYVNKGKLAAEMNVADQKSAMNTIATAKGVTAADLAVSAEFTIVSPSNTKSSYTGLQFRKKGGTMYEFRVVCSTAGVYTAELLRFVNNASTVLKTWTQSEVLKAMGVETLTFGTPVTLRAEAMGRDIFLYLNDKFLDVCTDDADNAVLHEGECTLKIINCTAWVDNFCIEEVTPRKPVGISLAGTNDADVITLYKGFVLEPGKYNIVVKYSDGFEVKTPLLSQYMSQVDGFADGDNQVTVSFGGFKSSVIVRVTERPKYVNAFVARLDALEVAKLTLEQKAAVKELKNHFDTLSPLEVQNLPEAVYKKYVDVIVAMDRLVTPEIADKELLYYNDFSVDSVADWDFTYESKVGSWDIRNGYFINEQFKYGLKGNGWAMLKDLYGEINMIEVDLAMVYPSTYTAVAWNITDEGAYYHCRMTNKLMDNTGKPVYAVQLYRCTGGHKGLDSVYTDIHEELFVAEGNFNTLRVVNVDGAITVYLDDLRIIAYNDSSNMALYEGGFAFKSSENDSMYDNIRIYGTKKERPGNDTKNIEPTYYEDDFENETVGQSPSHWQEEYLADTSTHIDAWKVYNKGGSKVYGTTGGKSVWSVLHAFECDPEISAKLMYTGSGKVGFLTRRYENNRVEDPDAFTAIGYDTATQKWFIAATESTLQEELQLIWAPKATPLAAGEWHTVELVLSGAKATLTVNGQAVLTCEDLATYSFGKMGVFTQNAAMYVDDFKVKSVNGTGFYEGVDQFTFFVSGDGTTHSEMQTLSENKMVALSGDRYVSYDEGYTWQVIDQDDNVAVPPMGGGGGYSTMYDYGNGEFISIYGTDMSVYRSTDNMQSWQVVGNVMPPEDMYDVYGNMCAIFHVGSLTAVTLKDGTLRTFLPVTWRRYTATRTNIGHYTRFFYSDDKGATWHEAQNDTRDVLLGYKDTETSTTAEGKVIGCADGSVRYYQTRNDYGSVIYFESKDGGITWTEFGVIPYMQTPKGSFGIAEDPENPGTWYMAWQNAWPVTMGSIHPRIRCSLARTTDGKNWEFLADVERTSTYANHYHAHVRQFLDPDVHVTDDYVYVTFGRSDTGKIGSTHNNQVPRFTRFQKDKLQARAWDDSTIWNSNMVERVEISALPQTKFGYADLFNNTGGRITEYSLNGTVVQKDMRSYAVLEEPNMYKLGKQTVQLYSPTLHTVSYEIEVVPNYDLIWTVKGKGEISPDPDGMLRIMEGASQTFNLKPAGGYKVQSGTVNGQKVKIRKGAFTLQNVQENQEITVLFSKLTVADYLPWIALGAVLAAAVAVGTVVLLKKQKKKAGKQKIFLPTAPRLPTKIKKWR